MIDSREIVGSPTTKINKILHIYIKEDLIQHDLQAYDAVFSKSLVFV